MRDDTRIWGVLLTAIIAVWVVIDAMRRGRSSFEALMWGLAVFCLCCVFLPAYLVGRVADKSDAKFRYQAESCHFCGLYYEGAPTYCPHCGRKLHEPMPPFN